MPLSGRLRRWAVGVAAVTLAVSACSAPADTAKRLDGWHVITLPDGMLPSTLAVGQHELLIGGYRPAGQDRTPALARLPFDGTEAAPTPVALLPTTPYGKRAELVFVTGSGDDVVAVGAAHGGAHANSRWTIWTGTTARLVDRPQTFETFGGWDAGTLLGLATDGRGPLVVGTWQGPHGPDGAVWRAKGERWVREPTATALANRPKRQVAPRTVSQQRDGSVVVNGSVIDLSDGVRQSAAYWRDVDGQWTLTALGDPGKRSDAWSTACDAVCWSVGSRDGAIAVWSDASRQAVPELPVDDADGGAVLRSGDRTIAAVSSREAGRLLLGKDGSWRAYTMPDGRVQSATLAGTRLYLVLATGGSARLIVRDLIDLLSR